MMSNRNGTALNNLFCNTIVILKEPEYKGAHLGADIVSHPVRRAFFEFLITKFKTYIH